MEKNRANGLAEAISLLMNAPILAAVTFYLVLISQRTSDFPQLLTTVLIFGTAAPLILVYILSWKGIIPDYYASKRESRVIPLTGAALSYLLGAAALFRLAAPTTVVALMLCYAVNTIVMLVITLRWKISIHASGITGPATFLFYTFGVIALPFFLLVLPVAWARLKLNAHTRAEILAGATLTIAITWFQLLTYFTII